MIFQYLLFYLPKKIRNMIIDDIKNRMKLAGVTNSQLAELTGANPAQLSLFFKGEGASLKTNILQKCFDELGIDTSIYTKRYDLAILVANKLRNKFSIEQVSSFSKEKMAQESDVEDVLLFMDVDYNQFITIKEKGIVDIESTYPFFRTMVLQLMGTGDQMTKSIVTMSLNKIASSLGLISTSSIANVSWGLGAVLGAFSTSTLRTLRGKKTAIFPLLSLTEYMLNNKK